jgi:hypothetical protein
MDKWHQLADTRKRFQTGITRKVRSPDIKRNIWRLSLDERNKVLVVRA